ncbi:MAG: FecR domain-containing protein [Phycisphaerales bacterium]
MTGHDEHNTPDYLWDRSGQPDAEIARLEALLRPAAFRARPLVLSDPAAERRAAPPQPTRGNRFTIAPRFLAAAAALLLAAVGALIGRGNASPAWPIQALGGTPRIAQSAVRAPRTLAVGQWLHTDSASSARLEVGTLGDVTVGPESRVRIKTSTRGRKVLELARGKIEAFITAPPRLFLVDTPAARAVDLGCAYTLEVDDDGAGVLHVTLGYVALEGSGYTSTVPRGASCAMRPGAGPGTPHFRDADPALLAALTRIDGDAPGAADLATVLERARPRDALTLWHLLPRTRSADRGAVFDRLAALAPPPDGVERSATLRLEKPHLDSWWQSLPY